jgi:agmatinase
VTPRISDDRLQRFRGFATRDLTELYERDYAATWQRMEAQGAAPFRWGFSGLGLFRAPLAREPSTADIVCVGLPLDIGSSWSSGSREGPKAIRDAGNAVSVHNPRTGVVPYELCRIADYGDLDLSGRTLGEALDAITEAFASFAAASAVPLALGGGHTVTYPILRGIVDLDEPVGVVQLDAHHDVEELEAPNEARDPTDGNQFTTAICEGLVEPERMIQIGIRSLSAGSLALARDLGITTITIDRFRELGTARVGDEIRRVVGGGPVYLSLDLDVLGSPFMPGVTLPEPFGLSDLDIRDILRGLRGIDLIGADVVELCPHHDPTGQSSVLAAWLAFEILCLLCEARCAHVGERRPTQWS